jgi:hypothetical protein
LTADLSKFDGCLRLVAIGQTALPRAFNPTIKETSLRSAAIFQNGAPCNGYVVQSCIDGSHLDLFFV